MPFLTQKGFVPIFVLLTLIAIGGVGGVILVYKNPQTMQKFINLGLSNKKQSGEEKIDQSISPSATKKTLTKLVLVELKKRGHL